MTVVGFSPLAHALVKFEYAAQNIAAQSARTVSYTHLTLPTN